MINRVPTQRATRVLTALPTSFHLSRAGAALVQPGLKRLNLSGLNGGGDDALAGIGVR